MWKRTQEYHKTEVVRWKTKGNKIFQTKWLSYMWTHRDYGSKNRSCTRSNKTQCQHGEVDQSSTLMKKIIYNWYLLRKGNQVFPKVPLGMSVRVLDTAHTQEKWSIPNGLHNCLFPFCLLLKCVLFVLIFFSQKKSI